MDEDLLKNNTIAENTGLHTEMEDGIEYVHVPIFINKNLNGTTKGYMDALYRESIHASNDLKTANETQLSLSDSGAHSF
jgi:hypothetical protein